MVEIFDESVHPQGGHLWEITKTKKRVLYKIRELVPGEIFGHDELIEHYEYVKLTGNGDKPVPIRKYRVVALDRADVFYINIANFYHLFSDTELDKLHDHIIPIDFNQIRDKVRLFFFAKHHNTTTLLDALNINQVQSFEHSDQRRYLNTSEHNVHKLDSFLDRVKKKTTCSEEIITEGDKIRILDVEVKKRIVKDLNEYRRGEEW